jgi:hypothetical protein
MTRQRRVRRLAMALLLAGAAGCGSTVAAGTQATGVTGSAPDSLSAPTGGSGAQGPATTTGGFTSTTGGFSGSTGAAGATGATGGSSGTTGVTGASTTGGSGSTGSRGGPHVIVGPGITPTTIYFGQNTSSQAAAGDRAIGASGAAQSYDFRDVVNAVVNYANKHGGFAGRKLKAIYYDYSLTADQTVQDQSACDFWTHDHKVFAMPGIDDILRTCAEKAGAVSLISGATVASTYVKYPHFIEPFGVRLDRLGTMTINGLYKAGYFAGKLGMITWDDPTFRYAFVHGYEQSLARHHIKLVDKAFIGIPEQIGGIADMSAAMRSVVTKFRSEGIDHVIIEDGHAGVWAGGGLTLEFMDQAESQVYHPRYGQNADNIPGSSELPSDQMDKAIAIMDSDAEPKNDAGWHENKTRQKCFKIEADAGFPVSTSNSEDEDLAAQACDTVFFLQRVINGLTTSLTSDAFVSGVAQLGRSWPSAYVYGTQFAPGLRDGSAEVRRAEYFQSCGCLRYAGPPYYP